MSTSNHNTVITANRLDDGEVVWLGHNGSWVEDIAAAAIVASASALEALKERAKQAENANHVVESYEMAVVVQGGSVVPVRFRERIRAKGPTIRLDLGKQAGVAVHAA
jgi:hypothetical protein